MFNGAANQKKRNRVQVNGPRCTPLDFHKRLGSERMNSYLAHRELRLPTMVAATNTNRIVPSAFVIPKQYMYASNIGACHQFFSSLMTKCKTHKVTARGNIYFAYYCFAAWRNISSNNYASSLCIYWYIIIYIAPQNKTSDNALNYYSTNPSSVPKTIKKCK